MRHCTLELQVPYYDYALDLILDVESPSDDMLTVRSRKTSARATVFRQCRVHGICLRAHQLLPRGGLKTRMRNGSAYPVILFVAAQEEQHEMVESAAEMLYGLIHARYILTSRGLASMLEKVHSRGFKRTQSDRFRKLRLACVATPLLNHRTPTSPAYRAVPLAMRAETRL